MVDRVIFSKSGSYSVLSSPATIARPVVTSVSQATLPDGSAARTSSRMASLTASATLSGCPSVTDSDEKYRRWFMSGASLSPQASGDQIPQPGRHLGLGKARPFLGGSVGSHYDDPVGVGAEPGPLLGDVVVDQEVDAFVFRLGHGAFDSPGLGGEANGEDLLRAGDYRNEDVGGGLQLDAGGPVRPGQLVGGRSPRGEVGDGGREHGHVGRHLLDGGEHLVGTFDRVD